MTVSVFLAAKRLGEQSDWTLTNLGMQKILYIANVFYHGKYGSPLVNGEFEAWEYGPVHPELYHFLKEFGSNPIKKDAFEEYSDTLSDSDERKMIDRVYNALKNAPPNRLVDFTHRENGAWIKNFIPGVRGIPISDIDIKEEYENYVNPR